MSKNGNKTENTSSPLINQRPSIGQKVSLFFLEKVILQSKLKGHKCKTLCKSDRMHISDPFGSDNGIVQINIF